MQGHYVTMHYKQVKLELGFTHEKKRMPKKTLFITLSMKINVPMHPDVKERYFGESKQAICLQKTTQKSSSLIMRDSSSL